MKAPQIIYLVMVGVGLLFSANKHGKQKTGNENFWSTLLSVAINLAVLFWGGFFK